MKASSLIETYISEAIRVRNSLKPSGGQKSLAQRRGYRKASRTKERRQYYESGPDIVEMQSHGYLFHYYYVPADDDKVNYG